MKKLYCIYNGDQYEVEKNQNELDLISRKYVLGFNPYVDLMGRELDNLFTKKLSFREVDIVYYEEIFFEYKGLYFSLYHASIRPENIEDDRFMIYTDSEDIAKKYNFEKKEQFVFIKYISQNEDR